MISYVVREPSQQGGLLCDYICSHKLEVPCNPRGVNPQMGFFESEKETKTKEKKPNAPTWYRVTRSMSARSKKEPVNRFASGWLLYRMALSLSPFKQVQHFINARGKITFCCSK